MKPKHILICALILMFLIGILFLQEFFSARPTGEAKSESLAAAWDIGDVQKIKFYAGSDQDENVELERKNGAWVVPAKFDAPALEERINILLQDLKGLRGEMRAENAELFSEFAIGDAEAVHLLIYGAGATVMQHILLGKETAERSGVFVRLNGESRIYAADKDLRSRLGISESPARSAKTQIEPEGWLDLQPFRNLQNEEVVKISLTSPGRFLAFERKQIESTGEPQEGDPKQELKTEWVLSQESAPAQFRVKQEGVEQIIPQLKNACAEDVFDPQKENECGFEIPTHIAVLTFRDKTEKALIIGGLADEDTQDRYAKIKGERLILKWPRWALNAVFREAKTLFELPQLSGNADKLCALTLCDPVKELIVEKSNGAWSLASPQVPFERREKAIDSLIRRWNFSTPDDIINLKDEPDLAGADYAAEIALSDSTRQTILVGATIAGREKERYLSISGSKEIFTIKDQSLTNLFPSATSLLTVRILECDRNKVESINLVGLAGEISLQKTSIDEPTYRGSILGYDFPASTELVSEILNNFTNIVPVDILGEASAEKSGLDSPRYVVTLKFAGAKELSLMVGNKTEKGYFAQTADSLLVYLISERAVELLSRPVSEILNLKVFDFSPDLVRKLTLRTAGKEVSLQQNEKGEWGASDENKAVKKEAVSSLLDALSNLCAVNVFSPALLSETWPEAPERSITVATKDGKSYYLRVEAPVRGRDELFWATLVGKEGLIQIPAFAIEKAMPEPETLFTDFPPPPMEEK